MSAVVRAAAGGGASDELCAAVYAATGGNPLYLTELLRAAELGGGPVAELDPGELLAGGLEGIGQRVIARVRCLGPARSAWRRRWRVPALQRTAHDLRDGAAVTSPTKGTAMAMTVREAFEKGTETFNAHDIDGFTGVLADDVVYRAPGGISGQGKAACAGFFAGWFGAFPDAHVEVHTVHITGDVAVEEGTFTGTHNGVLRSPAGDIAPTGRPVAADYIQVPASGTASMPSFSLMYDRLQMLEQLRLIPAPAG